MNDLPELCETLFEVEDPVLELDELWSFVLKKAGNAGFGWRCVARLGKWSLS